MSENDSSGSLNQDDPRVADRAFEARVTHTGETLPRWGRYVTIFEETVGLTPSPQLRTGTKIIDVFNAGVERVNRHFGTYLYQSAMRDVHDPEILEALKAREAQRTMRRIRETLARVTRTDEDERPDIDTTRTRSQ